MKQLLRLCGVLLLLSFLSVAWGQTSASKVARIDIQAPRPRRSERRADPLQYPC